ncbi:hypothetical protein ZIOFF_017208 [Zingiber officinale]|uniref:Uncharacterized protein n=1 Tax=Zingiber officinale TaxID=94328 RepID=A0A8J5LNU3_ZINOF|nr:hypothetical protein ZIOFF_017208 [Zingiber officinale]
MDFRWSTLWFIEVRLKSPNFWISISEFHRIVAAVSVLHVLHLWCVDSCDIFEMNLRFVLLSGLDLIVVYWTLKFCLEVGPVFPQIELLLDDLLSLAMTRMYWKKMTSDMGCHIDGFITVVAHTQVIQEGPVTGRAADVIAAANTAAEVALRLVRPGKKFTNLKYSRVEIDEVRFEWAECMLDYI